MAKKFLTDINIAGGVYDSSGDIGSSGQVLSSTGSGINWIDANSAASVVYQDGFTGNGSATAFTLANSIDNENKTQVYIDGVYQHKDNYSLSGTTLTFSTAPPNTSDIEVISFSTVSSADDILYDTDFASAGLMTTNGSGVYSITTNNSSNWNTAYTHSQAAHAPANAEQNVQSDWTATSGDSFIQNKPTIPSGNQIIDWTADQGSTEIHSGNYINTTYTVGDGGLTQNNFTNALKTKLDGIETSADVTDTANVTAAGALMDSELTDLAGVKGVTISNLATVSYVDTEVAGLVDSSPATLDTLNELAAALGDDPNFATTTANSIGTKLPLAGGTLTGAVVGTSFSAPSGFINGSNGGIRIHTSGTKFFNITAANAARDNIMDIGATDARFKDLFLGGSITADGATFAGSIIGTSANFSGIVYSSGGFRTGSANSGYNLFTRNSTGNTIFVQADQSNASQPIAKFSYGSATVNLGTAVLQVSKDNSHFVNCNVGIGTTSPDRKLDVRDSSNTQSTLLAYNQGTSFTGTVYEAITDRTASSDFNLMNLKSSTNSKFLVRGDGSVGIGVTPFAHSLGTSVNIDLLGNAGIWGYNNATYVNANAYYDSGWKYKSNGPAAVLQVGGSTPSLTFRQVGSGTAGAAITYTQPFTILASGKVGIGTTSPGAKLDIKGDGAVSGLTFRTTDSSNNETFYINDGGTVGVRYYPFKIGVASGTTNVANSRFQIATTGGDFVVLNDGKTGIGTTSPSYKLEVNGGTALVGGGFYVSTDQSILTNFSYTFRDGVGINNPNSISATANAGYTMCVGRSNNGAGVSGSISAVGTIRATAFTTGINTTAGIGASNGDVNAAEVGPGYLNLSRDDTAAAQQIRFEKNGALHSYIETTTSGLHIGGANVGIGTTSPGAKLQVNDAVYSQIRMHSDHSYSLNRNWRFITNNFGNGNWGGFSIESSSTQGGTSYTPKFGIDINGNVGIGINASNTTISDKLVVSSGNIRISNNSPILRLIDTDVTNLEHRILGGGNQGMEYSADVLNVTSGYHRWDIANSEKMRLIENGNLGINTTSPDGRLDVRGAISSGMALEDENVSLTSHGGTPQGTGILEISQGWSCSSSSGDTIVFRHNSTSWKAWVLHYNFASTNGITVGVIGGYWNNSGSSSNNFIINNLQASVAVTHGGTGNQNIIVTFTFTALGVHPLSSFKYIQHGGDAKPLASKTSITLNS